jgi:hypothetical protein
LGGRHEGEDVRGEDVRGEAGRGRRHGEGSRVNSLHIKSSPGVVIWNSLLARFCCGRAKARRGAGRRWQGRMARGVHGLPKVSPGTAMPYPCMPCGPATPETAIQGWPVHRAGGLRPSFTPLDIPCRTPLGGAERRRAAQGGAGFYHDIMHISV